MVKACDTCQHRNICKYVKGYIWQFMKVQEAMSEEQVLAMGIDPLELPNMDCHLSCSLYRKEVTNPRFVYPSRRGSPDYENSQPCGPGGTDEV